MPTEKTKEVLTNTEKIELKKSGTSYSLRVPMQWKKTLPCLRGSPLIFDAHVEKDDNGKILFVFEKEEVKPCETKRK